MLVLASTTDVLRVVTNSTATIDVDVDYVDKNGSSTSVGKQSTAINTATTTTIASSPAVSTQRGILTCSIKVKAGSATSSTVTVQLFDGATAYEIVSEGLYIGDELFFEMGRGWSTIRTTRFTQTVLTASGAGTYNTPPGVRWLVVECFGASGGSAGGAPSVGGPAAGGGSGGGGYSTKIVGVPQISYTYTVGAKGLTAVGLAASTAGGPSKFTDAGVDICLANGGGAGGPGANVATPETSGPGGVAATTVGAIGDLVARGNPGTCGVVMTGLSHKGGTGGAGARGYGGGVNGTSGNTGAAAFAGLNGNDGAIVITEYW